MLFAACQPQAPPEPRATAQADSQMVHFDVYLVALDSAVVEGPTFGCGDVLEPVARTAPLQGSALETAMRALVHTAGEGVLVNKVAGPGLAVEAVSFEGARAVVRLAGTLPLAGVCDHPRIQAQLRATALQFPEVDSVAFYVNGEPLDEYLSLQGR